MNGARGPATAENTSSAARIKRMAISGVSHHFLSRLTTNRISPSSLRSQPCLTGRLDDSTGLRDSLCSCTLIGLSYFGLKVMRGRCDSIAAVSCPDDEKSWEIEPFLVKRGT